MARSVEHVRKQVPKAGLAVGSSDAHHLQFAGWVTKERGGDLCQTEPCVREHQQIDASALNQRVPHAFVVFLHDDCRRAAFDGAAKVRVAIDREPGHRDEQRSRINGARVVLDRGDLDVAVADQPATNF